jgi:hypothetical protein
LREKRRLGVFENRVLRGIFGTKRDEVTGEWRKLPNEQLSDMYSSPTTFRAIKSRIMRLTRETWGKEEAYTRFCWGNQRERDHWGDPGVDEKIILNGSSESGM